MNLEFFHSFFISFMCRTKESISVIRPATRSSRSPRSSPRTGVEPSSSSSASGGDYPSTNINDWSLSSLSTQAALSLSSIKESLADNAHIYDFSEICSATGNLRAKRFSASSWRCRLRDKDVVIFQRKFRRPINTAELQRRLSAICKSHHVSLVKLLGASVSGNYIYLVYEFVPGANLAECLRNPRNPNFTVLSNWLSRMQIAADLADGLDYAHNSSGLNLRFVHNHISSSSIIVTEPSMNARICHFGTAALCGEIAEEEDQKNKTNLSRSRSRVTRIEGTKGYMAPELQVTGLANQKTDVFALGVVILELLSGSEPLKYRVDEDSGGYERESVIAAALAAAEGGRLRQWIDRRLRDSYPVDVAERMVRIGLECVESDSGKRPDMGRVAATVSKLLLESTDWAHRMGVPTDFSVSLAPR